VRALLIVLFLVVTAATGLALAPLGAALRWAGAERLGLSAAEATGAIWDGELRDARYGPLRLGDLEARLDPRALLAGRLRLHTRSEAGAFAGVASWTASSDERGVDAATGDLALGFIRLPVPLSGPARLEDVSVRFKDGRCAAAAGQVSAASAAGALTGRLACANGALTAPMQGSTPFGQTRLVLSVEGDGRYRAQTRVMAPNPATAASLRLAGFVDVGGAMERRDEGRLFSP
jgi:general secretion pathway protein N